MSEKKKAPEELRGQRDHLHVWRKTWVRIRGADNELAHVAATVCSDCLLAFIHHTGNDDYAFTLLLLKETGREPQMERDGFYFTVARGDVV